MLELSLAYKLLVALALGSLIGLEREYARYRKRGHDYAGIRTFPLISLFGALCAYLGEKVSVWILLLGILLTGALIITAYFVMTRKQAVHFGATSELAGFLTLFIGILSYYGEITLALVLAVTITIILYTRSILHHFAEKIKEKELSDTLKFAVISFIILPFLPNQSYGPHGLFNPYLTWLMVIFISGIGFAGYVLMKWFGEKGITLTGILGGLVSSTATTLSFAEKSVKEKKIMRALVSGVILANGVMFIRILIVVATLNRELFLSLFLPVSALILVTAIFSFFFWRKIGQVKSRIHLSSPFRLVPALKFGGFFALIIALVKLAEVYFSDNGVYAVSLISGFADVDAITISLSQLAKGPLALETAKNGIILAALTNMAVKGGMAYWFGGKSFGRMVLAFFAALILLGIALLVLL